MPGVGLKSDFSVWLIGNCQPEIVGQEDAVGAQHPKMILSHYNNQLPTNSQALKHLLYKKKTDMKGQPLSAVAQQVVLQIINIWDMAKIPSMTVQNAKKKLEKLFNKWIWLQKSEKKQGDKDIQNRKEFSDNLGILFDIACPAWENKITTDRIKSNEEREEDLRFLLDQRGPRKEVLGKFSPHYTVAYMAKVTRILNAEEKKAKEKERLEEIKKRETQQRKEALEDINDNDDVDEDYETDSKKPRRSKTVTLELPRKILKAPGVCQMLDRTKQSTKVAVGNIASIIKAGGGDLNDFDLSKSTAWTTRNATRKEEYDKFYSNFVPPKHSVVGWDGKTVKEVLGATGSVEYLAVVLSGAPHLVEGKMLEVEEIPDGTGRTQCDTTLAVLTACKATDSVKALLFDTTASNSGIRKGAATLLMKELKRVLMWFECRHHMAELFVKPVWIQLFGEETSPDWSDFGHFKKMFPFIKKEKVELMTIKPGLEQNSKEKTVELMTNLLKHPSISSSFQLTATGR